MSYSYGDCAVVANLSVLLPVVVLGGEYARSLVGGLSRWPVFVASASTRTPKAGERSSKLRAQTYRG